MSMICRERFLKVFNGEMPDRVPVTLFIVEQGHFLNQLYPDHDHPPLDHPHAEGRPDPGLLRQRDPPGTFVYACTQKPVQDEKDLDIVMEYEPRMPAGWPA